MSQCPDYFSLVTMCLRIWPAPMGVLPANLRLAIAHGTQIHFYGLPTIVCHERNDSQRAVGVRNCLTDEGRPLGIGLQEQVPNHLRRLWPKAMVVNAEGKGLGLPGQVTGKKRTARESPMKCRK
jgi:hypothetical protein